MRQKLFDELAQVNQRIAAQPKDRYMWIGYMQGRISAYYELGAITREDRLDLLSATNKMNSTFSTVKVKVS